MKLFSLPPALQHRVARGTARRALAYAGPYRRRLIVFIAVIVADAVAVVSTPLFIRGVINAIYGHRRTEIVVLAICLGTVALIDQVLTLIGVRLSARIGQGVIFDLRSAVYRHVQTLPLAFFTRVQTGALMSRLDNDVIEAQQAFSDLLSLIVGNIVMVGLSFVAMLALAWQLALVSLVALPLGALLARAASRRVAGLSRANLQLLSRLSTHMSERFNVGGALLVALFGRRDEDAVSFDHTSGEIRDLSITLATYSRMFVAVLLAMAGLITAAIFGWGGVLASDGALTVGTVVALATYIGRLYNPLVALGTAPIDVMNSLVSFERIFELLDVPNGMTESPDARAMLEGPIRVDFDQVDFSYPPREGVSVASLEPDSALDEIPRQVLFDLSFTIEPGQTVALVGHTGAGKTTIALLLRRLYDVTSGSVRLNGLDVREASFASLQHSVGMVTQDVHLFHDTVRANLLYAAPHATEPELRLALEEAQLLPVIDAMPLGLDTVVGDRGFRMSGGEKQRLALARMLLTDPSLVILDEATAQLDAETEAAVQDALRTALAGRTALVIAHRLSTVRQADEILVLEHGRIAERGTHASLAAREGHYFRLLSSQLDRPA